MPLLDLDELPEALDRHPLWSARRPALVRWRREDFLGDPELPLADAARELVRERTGSAPSGPVRLLAGLRFAGHAFNPISLLYLHGDDGGVEAVIAEVDEHAMGRAPRLRAGGRRPRGARDRRQAACAYRRSWAWSRATASVASQPGSRLALRISQPRGRPRRARGGAQLCTGSSSAAESMTRATLAYPAAGLATLARIYANAARLRLKGLRPVPHS